MSVSRLLHDDRDGPLPPLLLLLTVVTGLVDAASYLRLGHVFVANMTGNVVFLGFAIAGAKGLSIPASALALGAFLVGGLAGGRVGVHFSNHRGRLLQASLGLQLAAVVAAAFVALVADRPDEGAVRYALVVLLALAMGLQNATARRLAVSELTTTVLTMTLTGIAADSTIAGGTGSRLGRRSLAVIAMFVGALLGALLVLHIDIAAPLVAAAGMLAVVAFTTSALARTPSDWVGSAHTQS
jgi:uncharacterized membrane protein YoaK (UPF0700 family)